MSSSSPYTIEIDSDNRRAKVIVVIVSYGCGEEVSNCIASLSKSTYRDFEVFLVENGGLQHFERLIAALSASGMVEAVVDECQSCIRTEEFGKCAYFQLREGGQMLSAFASFSNLGFANAVNSVLRMIENEARWCACWLLNPDTEVDPSALEALVIKSKSGNFGLIGSRLVSYDRTEVQLRGGVWRRWLARPLAIGRGESFDAPAHAISIERAMDWVSGASCYASRAFIEQVGPLYEGFFLYCEDVDWSLRRGSYKLGYAHDSIVFHLGGVSTGSGLPFSERSVRFVFLRERNKLLLSRRHFQLVYFPIVSLSLILTLEYAVRGRPAQFVAALRGWTAGVRGQTGRPPETIQ